jgi:hypothetical protein
LVQKDNRNGPSIADTYQPDALESIAWHANMALSILLFGDHVFSHAVFLHAHSEFR